MSLHLKILDRKSRPLVDLNLSSGASVEDLKKLFYEKNKRKYHPNRQYFTKGLDENRVVLAAGKKLSELGIQDGDSLYFKDLGLQISWSTVFYIEYFGPILIHSLFYWFPQFFYSSYDQQPKSCTQTVAYILVLIHYFKREFETAFIHRFSLDTMPLFNIFKNSFHYWATGGLFIAYFLYHPHFTVTKSDTFTNICAALFLFFEFGNLYSHIILRNLRKDGSRERGIPRGFLFEYVTCANYTFELAAWLVFCLFTQTLTAYVFFVQSFVQIAIWALKKHKQLKKEFGDKAPKRKVLIPFIW